MIKHSACKLHLNPVEVESCLILEFRVQEGDRGCCLHVCARTCVRTCLSICLSVYLHACMRACVQVHFDSTYLEPSDVIEMHIDS